MPRVLILYNEPTLPPNHPDFESEHDVLETVAAVQQHLVRSGYEVVCLGATGPADSIEALRGQRPDAVFNLFEGAGGRSASEVYMAGLLEWLGVPFTGSPSRALCLADSKHLTKHLFRSAGIPTPAFVVADSVPVLECPLDWPVIAKPAQEHASVGMDQGSVVTNREQLNARVERLLRAYGPPVLVEQFIRGRELNVALVEMPELRALPMSEILFVNQDPTYWPIVTYDAKWKPGSAACEETPPRCPADVAPDLAARLEALAQQAFRLLGCRDYVRFDFRVSTAGEPYLLEANPNPDFNPTAGFERALTAAGITHAAFTEQLVRNALARG
jgi:D-alanine-D-alanine ligase